MSEEASPSSPGSPGENSANPSTQMGATLALDQVKLLPDLHLLTFAKIVEPIAVDVEVFTKIPRLVPVAQSALESRFGNSGLARNHGNLFGITATDSWKKSGNLVADLPTVEYVSGHPVQTSREFRAYKSWRDSFFDWARLISGLSIYKEAYALLKDPLTINEGITAMAKLYATDPLYAKHVLEFYHQLKQSQGG